MDDTVIESSRMPVLDMSVGLLSTGGDSQLLNELVTIFLQMTPAQLSSLEEAVTRGDKMTAGREAHSLKASAGALGAVGIRILAAAIEALAGQDEVETARPLVDSIERLVTQLRQEHGPIDQPGKAGTKADSY